MKVETDLIAKLLLRHGTHFFDKLPKYKSATRILINGSLPTKVSRVELIEFFIGELEFSVRVVGQPWCERISVFDLDCFSFQ